MKKTMKTANLVLAVLLAVVFVAQLVMMCMPYFEFTPKLTLKQTLDGVEATPKQISLEAFVWTEYKDMKLILVNSLQEVGIIEKATRKEATTLHPDEENALGERSNGYVMGIVGTTILGLVATILMFFTRKSWVQFAFTVAWAACGIYGFFTPNAVLSTDFPIVMESAATVYSALQILSVTAVVLTALRALPWFHVRFWADRWHPPVIEEEIAPEAV